MPADAKECRYSVPCVKKVKLYMVQRAEIINLIRGFDFSSPNDDSRISLSTTFKAVFTAEKEALPGLGLSIILYKTEAGKVAHVGQKMTTGWELRFQNV